MNLIILDRDCVMFLLCARKAWMNSDWDKQPRKRQEKEKRTWRRCRKRNTIKELQKVKRKENQIKNLEDKNLQIIIRIIKERK